MPSTSIGGCAIRYEILGKGVPVVLTGGAREPLEDAYVLAEKLAETRQVILWDRACVGQSDILFDGPRDLDLWAGQLAGLIERLGIGPVYLFGCSNGARVTLTTAKRYPDLIKGLYLTLITGGGPRPAQILSQLYTDAIDLIRKDGMAGLFADPYWSDRVAANPANRGILLAMNPEQAIRRLTRWVSGFDPADTILGVTDQDISRIEVPARILDITEISDTFRRKNRELAAMMPNAELVEDEIAQQQWAEISTKAGFGGGQYTSVSRLAKLVDAFVDDFEARA